MENFIEDLLNQLIEEAEEIKPINDFEKGKLFGYYFTIAKILNQASSFGSLDKLSKNLKKYNPESLLNKISE